MAGNKAPNTVKIVERVIDDAVVDWQKTAFLTIMNEVMLNLTGRVLKRDSGALIGNVGAVSGIRGGVIEIAVDLPYGKGWEQGFTRKSFYLRPVKAKALAWGGSVPAPPRGFKKLAKNQKFFSKGHTIPAKQFKARPFLSTAIDSTSEEVGLQLQDELNRRFARDIPDWKLNVKVSVI